MISILLSVLAVAPSDATTLRVGDAAVRVEIETQVAASRDDVLRWVEKGLRATAAYYGGMPAAHVRVVVSGDSDARAIHGTTWGGRDDGQALIRMRLGAEVSAAQLADDWTMTHELIHTAFPDLPDAQEWFQEGVATYVEPIARGQIADLTEQRIWSDMMRDMPQGEAGEGDRGLNHTHTWARTYWGGALFCFQADVAIRRATGSAKGLQDALRAIAAAGGTIDKSWPVERVLALGDTATGTAVLSDLYKRLAMSGDAVDLTQTWRDLGVHTSNGVMTLEMTGPAAELRQAIMHRAR